MPKKKKILTETLYAYLKPVNRKFLENYTREKHLSYSVFVDGLIEQVRKKQERPKAAA